MEHFSFADYRRRKVPLILVDEDSLKTNLSRMNVSSIKVLLRGRDQSDKQFIADTIQEMVMNSSENLYLWK